MVEVSSLSVVVGYDDSAVQAGVGKTSQTVSGLGSSIQTALGAAAIGAVAGLGAAFVGSAKTAMDFEKQLSAISAVSGATASQLDGIRSVALQLGKDTSFSASEAAAGMEEMVKAGVSLGDVMGGAGRAALDLAAAGGLSVAESATIASNAMNVFSLKGSDMAHVADVIAGAANASAIDVHDFGFSLSSVGAVAATVGLGLEDTATAIAVLGQAGLKGSDAGTSLKTMLLNLDPASKTARAAMKDLGLITAEGANQFFDAQGKAKSLGEIAGILQKSIAGLTKEQQINALQTIFGTDAIRAAAIMAKAGSAGFEEMAASMAKVSAQDVANERLNNLAGSIEKLKGSLETGAIMLGSLITPTLKVWADQATDAVNMAVDAIEQIPDVIGTVQQVLAGDWAPDLDPAVHQRGRRGRARAQGTIRPGDLGRLWLRHRHAHAGHPAARRATGRLQRRLPRDRGGIGARDGCHRRGHGGARAAALAARPGRDRGRAAGCRLDDGLPGHPGGDVGLHRP
jgi:TP901 family phage tail tape measure protein